MKYHRINRRELLGITAVGASAIALGNAQSVSTNINSASGRARLTLSWGLLWQDWMPAPSFEGLLSLIEQQADVFDEIYLGDVPGICWHYPVSEYSKILDVMYQRFEALRTRGTKRLGAFVYTTIGHDDTALGDAPQLPVPPMIGGDGKVTRGVACPTTPEFLAYITEKYKLLAKVSPDFIVVADDMRMAGHNPAKWGCFCPHCLGLFNQSASRSFGREELWGALNKPDNQRLRRDWVEQNARTLEAVYRTIGTAIHDIRPNLEIGTETLAVEISSYSGSAYERWFTALQGTRAKADLGYYWDSSVGPRLSGPRNALIDKSWDTSRQTLLYPAQVRDRRYELETYPDGILIKDPQTYVNEIAIALVSSGCNGADIRSLGASPPEEYLPVLTHIGEARPYLETVLQYAAGTEAIGLWPSWSRNMLADRRVLSGETWLPDDPWQYPLPMNLNLPILLAEIGIPMSMRDADIGTILSGRTAESLSDESLQAILCGGVLMDAVALQIVNERGFNKLTGVRIDQTFADYFSARMTADSLNGRFANSRMAWLAPYPKEFPNSTLLASEQGVRWLTNLEDNSERHVKGPCMSAFENSKGGRVVVSAFIPWWYLNRANRRYQLLQVADWLSKGSLPLRIEEPIPLTPYVRLNKEGTKGIVLLFNTGLSEIRAATIRMRTPAELSVEMVAADKIASLEQFRDSTGHGVRIRNIRPWSTVSLLLG